MPRDYITLLGDSYAEGQGDGLLAANGDRAKFVQSAHVLQRLTGHDAVSLGSAAPAACRRWYASLRAS